MPRIMIAVMRGWTPGDTLVGHGLRDYTDFDFMSLSRTTTVDYSSRIRPVQSVSEILKGFVPPHTFTITGLTGRPSLLV